MPCPTCDHTMSAIGMGHWGMNAYSLFHCGRCGTLKQVFADPNAESVYTPRLVMRVQGFLRDLPDMPPPATLSHLSEMVFLPENRWSCTQETAHGGANLQADPEPTEADRSGAGES